MISMQDGEQVPEENQKKMLFLWADVHDKTSASCRAYFPADYMHLLLRGLRVQERSILKT